MRFSIITPAWEVASWLPTTIESVLSQQGDFEIEYIVVADRSKDATVAIAKEYAQKVTSGTYAPRCNALSMHVIEPHEANGMYVALNTGIDAATGDIFAWIAGDDIYEPGAFAAMAQVFTQYPDIVWAKGITSTIGESGERINEGVCSIYHQDWLRRGVYGMEAYHVEQDSNFWRRELWGKVKPFPSWYRSAGDYWLWIQMARHARLWSVNVKISAFRKREGQDSRANHGRLLIQKKAARPKRPLMAWIPRLFFYPYYRFPALRPFMRHAYPYLFPLKSRMYLAREKDTWVKRTAPTFMV